MNKILAADTGGHAMHKAHELSVYALAGATPVALLSKKGGFLASACDWTFALAIPVHSHISLNACVTDYLPRRYQGAARVGVLGATLVTYLGLMKVNLAGPGVTQTVLSLWKTKQ